MRLIRLGATLKKNKGQAFDSRGKLPNSRMTQLKQTSIERLRMENRRIEGLTPFHPGSFEVDSINVVKQSGELGPSLLYARFFEACPSLVDLFP